MILLDAYSGVIQIFNPKLVSVSDVIVSAEVVEALEPTCCTISPALGGDINTLALVPIILLPVGITIVPL
jgi:hypothetical protein